MGLFQKLAHRCRIKRLQIAVAVLSGLFLVFQANNNSIAAPKFQSIPMQFIAALGDPNATSGNSAHTWGIWRTDPAVTGLSLGMYGILKNAGGYAPGNWKFDENDWWLEEHGLIMDKPEFPLPAGKYMVTGEREVTAVLTVHPPHADGTRNWELDRQAKLFDVTHMPCRSARYTPANGANSCTPAKAPKPAFPVAPGTIMPTVDGCAKQDYAVLLVIAKAVE